MRAQRPERVTAPASGIVTLAQVKEFLRIDEDEAGENALLNTLIASASYHLDGYGGLLGRALITQGWRQRFSDFPEGDDLPIPLGPVQGTPTISYVDQLGTPTSFTGFHLISLPLGPALELQDGLAWPLPATRPDSVTLTWTAGYGNTPADVPEPFQIAALQLIAHWYATREAVNVGNIVTEVPWGLRQTIASMRDFGG
jgi:uncharacterized phiE125 gp8 family phage protein